MRIGDNDTAPDDIWTDVDCSLYPYTSTWVSGPITDKYIAIINETCMESEDALRDELKSLCGSRYVSSERVHACIHAEQSGEPYRFGTSGEPHTSGVRHEWMHDMRRGPATADIKYVERMGHAMRSTDALNWYVVYDDAIADDAAVRVIRLNGRLIVEQQMRGDRYAGIFTGTPRRLTLREIRERGPHAQTELTSFPRRPWVDDTRRYVVGDSISIGNTAMTPVREGGPHEEVETADRLAEIESIYDRLTELEEAFRGTAMREQFMEDDDLASWHRDPPSVPRRWYWPGDPRASDTATTRVHQPEEVAIHATIVDCPDWHKMVAFMGRHHRAIRDAGDRLCGVICDHDVYDMVRTSAPRYGTRFDGATFTYDGSIEIWGSE